MYSKYRGYFIFYFKNGITRRISTAYHPVNRGFCIRPHPILNAALYLTYFLPSYEHTPELNRCLDFDIYRFEEEIHAYFIIK